MELAEQPALGTAGSLPAGSLPPTPAWPRAPPTAPPRLAQGTAHRPPGWPRAPPTAPRLAQGTALRSRAWGGLTERLSTGPTPGAGKQRGR